MVAAYKDIVRACLAVWFSISFVIPQASADLGPTISSFRGSITSASCSGTFHYAEKTMQTGTPGTQGVGMVVFWVFFFLRVASGFPPGAGGGDQGEIVWSYTCDVSGVSLATVGLGGLARRVYLEGPDSRTGQYHEEGQPCEYVGTWPSTSCEARAVFPGPTPAGGGSGRDEYPYGSFPVSADVCIHPDANARAVNAPQAHVSGSPLPAPSKRYSEMNPPTCVSGVTISWTPGGAGVPIGGPFPVPGPCIPNPSVRVEREDPHAWQPIDVNRILQEEIATCY